MTGFECIQYQLYVDGMGYLLQIWGDKKKIRDLHQFYGMVGPEWPRY